MTRPLDLAVTVDSVPDPGLLRPAIEADRQAGVKARVSGTPAFFINGIPLSGAQPASVFEKTIDAELSRMNQLHQTQ